MNHCVGYATGKQEVGSGFRHNDATASLDHGKIDGKRGMRMKRDVRLRCYGILTSDVGWRATIWLFHLATREGE